MGWESDIEELRRGEALARQMGGPDKIKRQHDAGRLTVRERIDLLLDPGSFHEIGAVAGRAKYAEDGELQSFQPANFVFGRGRIEGRPVVVGGDDFTVRGGAADASIRGKQVQSEQMANELRIPLVRLIDGTGGGGSVKTIETMGYTYVPANPAWDWVVANMGTVPVVALGLGSVAGLGAARLAASHYSVSVEGISQMFIAGPPVVARAGQTLTKEELGGSEIHARAGAVDDVVASEAEAFARARRFLSYLPSSVHELAERMAPTDDPARRDPWLIEAVPHDRRKVYDMRRILAALVDADSLFEIGRKFGGSVITALARLDGWPVAVLASDPYFYGGGWTADAAQKVTRFVDLANTFHLPVVHLVDVPGFVIGVEAEKARQDPLWCPRARRDLSGARAVLFDHHPKGVRRRRRGPHAAPQAALSLRLAVGRLGLAPGRGRDRGGLPRRARRRTRPRQTAPRERGAPQPLSLALPHRRDVPDRGDHRPARHAAAAVRVREPDRQAARSGARRNGDAAIGISPPPPGRSEYLYSCNAVCDHNILRRPAFSDAGNAYILTTACSPIGPPLGSLPRTGPFPCKFATASSKPSATRR